MGVLQNVTSEAAKPTKAPGLPTDSGPGAEQTAFMILSALAFCHFLNDMMQSMLPAIYPMLKENYALSFAQIGVITLAFQGTASMLQPIVGIVTDKRSWPYALSVGMGFTLVGLFVLANASHYPILILGAAMVGMGSSIFHPDSSRVARMASGGRHGLAQSYFQVGGYVGTAIGPLLAAFIIVPRGQGSISWFSVAALIAMIVLFRVGNWYASQQRAARKKPAAASGHSLPRGRVRLTLLLLTVLVFSKHFYLASISSYYTFFLIHKFGVSVRSSEVLLFVFLAAAAVGTLVGGPVGDRIGRKYVIWVSILGVLPFTLALPYANLFWTVILSVVIGLILSSAFSAIVVYGQELMPGRVGMVAGIFFGLAFGIGGIGAAALGKLADWEGIEFVYHVCSWLPAIGLLTVFLPDIEGKRWRRAKAA